MENHDQRRKWHFDRGVSVDAIIAFVTACGAVVIAWVNINSRLSVMETTVSNITAEAIKRTEDAKIAAALLGERFNRMEDKIDLLRRDLLERKK